MASCEPEQPQKKLIESVRIRMDRKTNLAILKKELTVSHPDVRKQKLAIEETGKQLTKEVNRVLKSADERLTPQLTDLVVQQISAESQNKALSSRTQRVRRDRQSPVGIILPAPQNDDLFSVERRRGGRRTTLQDARRGIGESQNGCRAGTNWICRSGSSLSSEPRERSIQKEECSYGGRHGPSPIGASFSQYREPEKSKKGIQGCGCNIDRQDLCRRELIPSPPMSHFSPTYKLLPTGGKPYASATPTTESTSFLCSLPLAIPPNRPRSRAMGANPSFEKTDSVLTRPPL